MMDGSVVRTKLDGLFELSKCLGNVKRAAVDIPQHSVRFAQTRI